MAGGCCAPPPSGTLLRLQRRALVAVLAINLVMFVIEVAAGWTADSVALQADALDFLGDAINYATALLVLGWSMAWRAGTAMAKGLTMCGFGLFVLGGSLYNALTGAAPQAHVMGWVGALALAANVACALILFRFRAGDANLRAVWLCSRNDVIGNLAVLAAAAGVFASGTAWPDLAVGLVMASLALWSGVTVVRQARTELREASVQAAE